MNHEVNIDNNKKKLKLYYGENTQGIEIVSNKGEGTSISFTIPCFKN